MKKGLKDAAATAIALITGFIGLAASFSDLGRNETLAERIVPVAVIYFVACFSIGVMFEKQWYLAAFTSWGPVLLLVPALLSKLMTNEPDPYWSFIFALSSVPVFALASGYAGARLRRLYRTDQSSLM